MALFFGDFTWNDPDTAHQQTLTDKTVTFNFYSDRMQMLLLLATLIFSDEEFDYLFDQQVPVTTSQISVQTVG